jgi:hypothetical protein
MTATPGTDMTPYPTDWGNVGLEDVGLGDLVVPRIKINHPDGRFVDSLSGNEYPKLECILLGMTKQRMFWPDNLDEGDRPRCKSPDFQSGFPNVDATDEKKRFPWELSNFNPADYPPEAGINGHPTLPCESCALKEWNIQGWKQPPCNDVHTYALLYSPDGGASWLPGMLSLSKTGIRPSKAYLSSFIQSKQVLFTYHTTIELQVNRRGTVNYSVPKFTRGEPTDQTHWAEYAEQARTLRDFVRQPPREKDDEGTPVDNTHTGPVSTPAPTTPRPATSTATPTPTPVATATPVTAPAVVPPASPSGIDDDDLPF